MNLSTRCRYGTRAMAELARLSGGGPVRLETLADNQGIPIRYLAKIVQDLRRAGLVRSVRGAHGGYMLGGEPPGITVGQIVMVLDGGVSLVDCATDPDCCERSGECTTRKVWADAGEAMRAVLNSVTLQDLVNGYEGADGD